MPAIRPKPNCPKKERNRQLASLATRSLAELERGNPESAIYDFIEAARQQAAAIESWFTPAYNTESH